MAEVEPRLAPPGAGIPLHERLAVKYLLLPKLRRKFAWDEAVARFVREGERIQKLVVGVEPARLSKRVLIERLAGLEDSSRYWSVAMTLEHLAIVGGQMAEVIVQLSQNRVPPGVADTAKVKPQGAWEAASAPAAYETFVKRFVARVTGAEIADRAAKARFAHPWFGPIDAHSWLLVAGIHQSLHRKQCELILRSAN